MRRGLVLFDLDGTLVDSAPDLCAAANFLRTGRGKEPLPFEALRNSAGKGARGLIGAALGVGPEDAGYQTLERAFLAHYVEHIADQTEPFPGVLAMLEELHALGFSWGVVTNKVMALAEPIVKRVFQAGPAPATLVAGDTTGKRKPNPTSLLYAMRSAGFECHETLYIGDEQRDIQAAQAAGMASIVASWGYALGWETWNANAIARFVSDIPNLALELLSATDANRFSR